MYIMEVTNIKISKRGSVLRKSWQRHGLSFPYFYKIISSQNRRSCVRQKRNKEFLWEAAYLEFKCNICRVIQILGKTPTFWQTSNSCALIPWKGFILISYSFAYDSRVLASIATSWNNNIFEKLNILVQVFLKLLGVKQKDFQTSQFFVILHKLLLVYLHENVITPY